MQALPRVVRSLITFTGGLTGSFTNVSQEEQESTGKLNALGEVISLIVESCTFHPPKSSVELRAELVVLSRINKQLGKEDRFQLPHIPEKLIAPNNSDMHKQVHKEIYGRYQVYKIQDAELQRQRAQFNPVGGLVTASLLILCAYSIASWVTRFLPDMLGKNCRGGMMCMTAAAMGSLTYESVTGWSRINSNERASDSNEHVPKTSSK